MKQFYRVLLFSLICMLAVNLTGCCSHGGGGDSGGGTEIASLQDAVAAKDGSLYYENEGLRLSAMPGTFDAGAVIKIKKQSNNIIETLNLAGKGVSAASALYLLEFQTNTRLLYNMATASIILDSGLSSSKKGYFGLERSSVKLVTSELQNTDTSVRASTNTVFNLPFVETFKKIALVTFDNEKFSSDPLLSTDGFQKDVENSQYTSDTHVEMDLTTVAPLSESMTYGKNASIKLLLKGENVEFYKTASRLSTKFENTSADNNFYSASVDLFENGTMVPLGTYAANFNLDLNSAGLDYESMPRRLVLEGCYTGSDNVPVCSQEYIVYYNSPVKPYVISTSPSNGSTIYGLTKVTVNFSEPMKTDTVTCSIKSSLAGDQPTLSNYSWNSSCLTMDATLGSSKAVYTITVGRNSTSKIGSKLATNMYGENSDYTWSFTYDPRDLFVELISPSHGSTNVSPVSSENSTRGPDLVLHFSEVCSDFTAKDKEAVTLVKTGETKEIDFTPIIKVLEQTYTLTPDKPLEYMTEYTVRVSKDVIVSLTKHTLSEDYVATFTTSSGFASGNGTSAMPFMITSQKELENVGNAAYVDKNYYFKVANNIKFDINLDNDTFTPIGSTQKPFKGHFDGNNKTLEGFIINEATGENIGLFGSVTDSTINNVVLKDSTVTAMKNVGSLVGKIKNTRLNNIKVVDPSFESISEVMGGIVGLCEHSSVTDSQVTSSASVLPAGIQNFIGGIAGIVNNSKIVRTDVDIAELGGGDTVGGIAGKAVSSVIQKSNVKVIITGSEHNIGGIVGTMESSSVNYAKIQDGSLITGQNFIGGITGYASSSSELTKCSVSAQKLTGGSSIGGLAGCLTDAHISTSCVPVEMEIVSSGNRAGGVVGHLDGESSLYLVYSNATINGNSDIGGLAGLCNNVKTTIKNSIANNAKITAVSEDTTNRVLGNGEVTLTDVYAMASTTFVIGPKTDIELRNTPCLTGILVSKENLIDRFKEIGFDATDWNYVGTNTPVLK